MEYQHTLDEIVYGEESYTFPYTVNGYSNEDMISICVSRHVVFDPDPSIMVKPLWAVSMSHESSSHTNESMDDIDASSNFVAVMLEAIDFAMILKGQIDMFEASYKKKEAQEQEARDIEMKDPEVSNATQLHPNLIDRMDAMRALIDAGVRAAFCEFTAEQVNQLIMAPYIELQQETQAAAQFIE